MVQYLHFRILKFPLNIYVMKVGFIYGQATDPSRGLSHILRQGDRLKQLLDAMEDSQDFQVGAAVFTCEVRSPKRVPGPGSGLGFIRSCAHSERNFRTDSFLPVLILEVCTFFFWKPGIVKNMFQLQENVFLETRFPRKFPRRNLVIEASRDSEGVGDFSQRSLWVSIQFLQVIEAYHIMEMKVPHHGGGRTVAG